jgi:hypothetical protein
MLPDYTNSRLLTLFLLLHILKKHSIFWWTAWGSNPDYQGRNRTASSSCAKMENQLAAHKFLLVTYIDTTNFQACFAAWCHCSTGGGSRTLRTLCSLPQYNLSDSTYFVHSHNLVGVQGFEPWTLCSQSRCATRLRYTPIKILTIF